MTFSENFWIAVLAMMALTYMSRALPFLLPEDHPILRWLTDKNSPLAALGPSLIAAIAGTVIVPDLLKAAQGNDSLADFSTYALGLAATVLTMKYSKNAGIAVIVGMIVFGLTKAGIATVR